MLALRAETQTIPILFSKLVIPVILILILVICGAVKSRSTENLVAGTTAAAEPKMPERATKVKGADEANRRLMALNEEDRRSVFLRILALAKEHCVEITRTCFGGNGAGVGEAR